MFYSLSCVWNTGFRGCFGVDKETRCIASLQLAIPRGRRTISSTKSISIPVDPCSIASGTRIFVLPKI